MGDQGLPGRQEAHNAMDFGGFEGFSQRQWRQDCRELLGQHRLAGPRRTNQQPVVCCFTLVSQPSETVGPSSQKALTGYKEMARLTA